MTNQEKTNAVHKEKTNAVHKVCGSCKFWSGNCRKGKVNKTANSPACEKYKPKGWLANERKK